MPATVTGRLVDRTGTRLANTQFQVNLKELMDPGGSYLKRITLVTTDASGNFTIGNLYRGKYELVYNNVDKIKFMLPDSVNTYTIDQVEDLGK